MPCPGRVTHHWGNLSGSGNEEALRKSTSTNVGPWSFTAGEHTRQAAAEFLPPVGPSKQFQDPLPQRKVGAMLLWVR